MSDTYTIKYDTESRAVKQLYCGTDPNWDCGDGCRITTAELANTMSDVIADARANISTSDYNEDEERPVVDVLFNPIEESLTTEVRFEAIQE